MSLSLSLYLDPAIVAALAQLAMQLLLLRLR